MVDLKRETDSSKQIFIWTEVKRVSDRTNCHSLTLFSWNWLVRYLSGGPFCGSARKETEHNNPDWADETELGQRDLIVRTAAVEQSCFRCSSFGYLMSLHITVWAIYSWRSLIFILPLCTLKSIHNVTCTRTQCAQLKIETTRLLCVVLRTECPAYNEQTNAVPFFLAVRRCGTRYEDRAPKPNMDFCCVRRIQLSLLSKR